MFPAAIRAAHRAQARVAGADITFTQDGQAIPLRAVVGESTFETTSNDGSLIRHESRDYLVLTDELSIAGAPLEPKRGATIEETAGGQTLKYELLDLPGIPCWRWSDQFRVRRRLHVKLFEEA